MTESESTGTEPDERKLRFNICGPLEVWTDGNRLRLGGAIQERVLVMLLLEHGKVLPVSRLVAGVWDEEPPATAAHQVRKAVADLRRRIPQGSSVLVTDGPGYRAVVSVPQLDLCEFEARVHDARLASAAGAPADAVEALNAALALWRGPVLSGQGGPVVDASAVALEEGRLAAAERYFDLRLRLGEASMLVVELRELVTSHPLREAFRGQLMLALYRSGRQAEALGEYGAVRELLAEELGIDPGPELTRLHEGILRESPELAAPVSPPAVTPAVTPPTAHRVPCDLPYDLADFTGRERELRELLACAHEADDRSRIVAIDGMGGSGKTSLAVRAAYRLAAAHPDGQLHIDLRGHTPGEQPVTVGTALDILLRSLDVPGGSIPEDVPGRTALWRSTLAGKRVLLLLDNAPDAAGVVPLLPTSPGCLAIVTSRARLVDLDGAKWISVDVLAPDESAALVAETVGAHRVAAEPEAARELAQLCGHLPLALRIAAARLHNRPRWTVQYLTDRLRDETRRLDELSLGERSVAATLRLSYQALNEECRTAFRVLALHPGGDIDLCSAAALLGLATREAEDVLEFLLDVHLLQQPEMGLYSLHDLVRAFARGLLCGTTEEEDATSVGRLLDYYLAATEVSCEFLFPGRRRRPTGVSEAPTELPDIHSAAQAGAWFVREHTTLLATVDLAEARGYDRHAACLARNLSFQLNASGYLEEFADLSRTAVAAARRLNDLALLGVALSNLGVACWKLGRFVEGIEVAEEGRKVAQLLGDRHTEAHCGSTLGLYKSLLGRFPEALADLQEAIATERELGSVRAEAESLTILSALYEQWGRYREAVEAALRAVELTGRLEQHENELVALTDLAFAHFGLEEYAEAEVRLARARELCDGTREPGQVALVLALSAESAHRLGRSRQESEFTEQARALVRQSLSPLRRAKVENLVARLLRRNHQYDEALTVHRRAYELASSVGYRAEEAYALAGMAEAAGALGDGRSADEHRGSAEELFAELGIPGSCRRS